MALPVGKMRGADKGWGCDGAEVSLEDYLIISVEAKGGVSERGFGCIGYGPLMYSNTKQSLQNKMNVKNNSKTTKKYKTNVLVGTL